MNPRIIGFAGPAGSGKDTCGSFFIMQGYNHLSFATPLKKALEAMGLGNPLTIAEKEAYIPKLGVTWRHCAQTLGTEWGRQLIHPDIWVKLAENTLEKNPEFYYVLTDVRFENEAAMIRRNKGIVCHIKGRAMGTGNDRHASEQSLDIDLNDWVVHNTRDLDYLYKQLNSLCNR